MDYKELKNPSIRKKTVPISYFSANFCQNLILKSNLDDTFSWEGDG